MLLFVFVHDVEDDVGSIADICFYHNQTCVMYSDGCCASSEVFNEFIMGFDNSMIDSC